MKKFALILSGCGVYDGSEIHEAVMAMLAVSRAGATYQIYAPDKKQHHVIDHFRGEPVNEERNVLTESARIARGKISPLSEFRAGDCDALILPGGFGAAKNLSTYAFDGAGMQVDPEVERALRAVREAGKPIGAMCISPVILARVFGKVRLTIGGDAGTAAHVEGFGATHVVTGNGEITVDRELKIVTTPCYMLDAGITDIAEGAQHMVNAMMELM